MSSSTNDAIYREASSGDVHAYNFLRQIIGVAHVWDDLIDRDREVTDEEINGTFATALMSLPANPFYASHRSAIDPVLMMSMVNWRAATDKERESPCEWSYILRSDYVNLIVLTKVLTDGVDAAVKFARVVRDDIHHEQMHGYASALREEQEKRGA